MFFFSYVFFFRKIENFWKSKKKNTEKITIDWGHIEDLKKPFSAQKTWFLPPFFEFFRFFKKSELFWGNPKTVKKLSFSAKKGVFSLINITGTKGNFSCIFLVVLKKFRFSKKKHSKKKHRRSMFFFRQIFQNIQKHLVYVDFLRYTFENPYRKIAVCLRYLRYIPHPYIPHRHW